MGNFFGRLRERFIKIKQVGPLRDDNYIWRSLRQVSEAADEITRPYSQSVWVYSALHTIAQNIARVPFRIYREEESYKQPIESGELYNLFLNPNPYLTGEQLFEATTIYMGLRGEAFWILEGIDKNGDIPTEIWTFDPIRFAPIFDPVTGFVAGWTYHGLKEIQFDNSEIIHFKYFNPYDDVRGLSPLSAIKMGVEQDFYASRYNRTFFRDGATLGGFLTTDGKLSDEQYNRLINQFEQRHRGAHKAHRVGILEGGMRFQEVRLSNHDMEFIELKKLTREEIFAAFKVNSVVLGLYEDVKSYEGIKTAHRAYWHECLIPKLKYMEGILWSRLFSKMGGGRTWGEFDLTGVESLQDNFMDKVKTAKELFFMGWPINAINHRLDLGMQDVSWGDSWWTSKNNIDINKDAPQPEGAKENPMQGPDNSDPMLFSMPHNDERLQRYVTIQSQLERRYKKKLERFLFETRKGLIEGILNGSITGKDDTSGYMDMEGLRKMLSPIYADALVGGVETVERELAPAARLRALPRRMKEEWIDERFGAVSAKLSGIVTAHIGKGLSQRDISLTSPECANLIRDIFNTLHSRTLSIARTETAGAMSFARYTAMKSAGIERHIWITNMDGRERDSHKLLNGAVAKTGEKFIRSDGTITSLRYPCDPTAEPSEIINCRCITVAVF